MSSEPGRPVLLLDKSGEAEPDPLRPPLQVHVFTKVRNGVGLENLHPLPEPEPEPESEPQESAEEAAARERFERLSRLTADETSMREWSEAQVSEWITLIDLPDGCSAETVQELFSDMDGCEVLGLVRAPCFSICKRSGLLVPVPQRTCSI